MKPSVRANREEILRRLAERPVAYLPMGMVEPHGHAAAFGLDLIKAEDLCDEAAARFGGIVAPPQTYPSSSVATRACASRLGAPDLPTLTFDDVEPAWAAGERQRPSWVSYGPISG